MDLVLSLLGVRLALWAWVIRSALPGLLTAPHRLAWFHDEHYWFAHDEAARTTISTYHQLPAWNPFYCGGIPLLASPQDASLSPESLLKIVLGVGPGRRLSMVILFVLGMEGFYRLARRYEASGIGAAALAIVFALCGFFLDVAKLGWLNFFGLQLLPWIVLAFESGLRSWKWRVAGGLLVGWLVLQGGTYTLPYTVFVLVALTVSSTLSVFWARHGFWTRAGPPPPGPLVRGHTPVLTLTVIGLVGLLASAVRLLPMLHVAASHPRVWQGSEALPWSNILARIVEPSGHVGQNAYIGWSVVVLAGVGAAVDRRARSFGVLALVFFLFTLGDFSSASPSSLLKYVPILKQLRLPHRMVVLVAFFLCLAAARTLTIVEDLFTTAGRHAGIVLAKGRTLPWPSIGAVGGAILGAATASSVAIFVDRDFLRTERLEVGEWGMAPALTYEAPFRQSRGNRWDAHVWAPASLGSLQCFEETPFPQSRLLRGDLPAEEYPIDPTVATVERVSWSPNAITLQVDARAPTTILVNQNYASEWRSNIGTVRSHEELLGVDVPAGRNVVTLRYRDPWIYAGLGVSLIAWGAVLVLLVAYLARRARSVAAGIRARVSGRRISASAGRAA